MSDHDTVDFLASVPLLEDQDETDLAELARVMRRRTVRAGQSLWRQGDEARDIVFVVDGTISTSLRAPGDRTVELGRVGARDILGEIALLDGQGQAVDARVTETATILALSRSDFTALLAGQKPGAFSLKRRLACLLTMRLREQLRHLGASLGDESPVPSSHDSAPAPADLEQARAPDSRYVRRMAMFHDFDPLALWGFLTSGKYVRCGPGEKLVAEGMRSEAYYLTINGAVEKVLIRGDRRIRVGLAGPGLAFGYESLLDDGPCPVSAIARERALLLILPRDVFHQLFHREDAVARVFLEAIHRDLLVTLRQTLRPWARLTASL